MKLVYTLLLILVVIFIGSSIASAAQAQDGSWVWWEGEKTIKTNFPSFTDLAADTFYDIRDEVLSNGDWLTISGKRAKGSSEPFATYQVSVAKDGTYDLWVRKFWKHGPFRWRFDSQDWQVCGPDVALADNVDIRQYLCVNWVYLGKAKLSKGKHNFELRLTAKEGQDTVACFDAFLLTTSAFMPMGRLKPGEKWNLSEPGWFAYEPGLDRFESTSKLDLRYLNEATAGMSGHVRREGSSLVLGNGTPVKFWAVNVGTENAGQSRASVDYLARKLAKLGVNMVRFHSSLFKGQKVDPVALDNLHYLVSAMKKQGIYTTLSFYFPLWVDITQEFAIPGYDTIGNKKPFALPYFNGRMKEVYKGWMKNLLTSKNPYTGQPLGQDPAVAITELVNEDSYFFWTFTKGNIPAIQWANLESQYGSWLVKKYGSLSKAFESWGKISHPADDLARGIAGLYEAWDMTKDGSRSGGAAKTRRIGDQVRFLAESQMGFYTDIINYARETLGAKCLFSASNWTVTDISTLDAIERYTYTAGDVIDKHGYFGGKHEGDGADYSVRVGHTFKDASALKAPEVLPLQVFQVDGYPHIISELGWTQPNRFRAEFPMLTAAYGALQGLDSVYLFATGSNFLIDSSIGKFQICSPAVISTFPAAALMYRLGYVSEGKRALNQVVKLDDLFAMKGTGMSTAKALDDLRKKDIPVGGEAVGEVNKLDPLSFYVGPIVRTYGDDPSKSTQVDFSKYIDRDGKIVKSATGELMWNYRQGLLTVNSPYCQGLTGYLAAAGPVQLTDISVESANEYGSIVAVSLDGQPIASSKRILVQAMTEDKPYGWSVDGSQISELGRSPFNIKEISAKVTFNSFGKGRVSILDLNGNLSPKAPEVSTNGGSALQLRLSPDVLYYVVER